MMKKKRNKYERYFILIELEENIERKMDELVYTNMLNYINRKIEKHNYVNTDLCKTILSEKKN